MGTAQEIKKYLSSDARYWKRNGMEYSGPSPLRSGSDGTAFHLSIDSDEFGRFNDFKSGEKGSLYTLAKLLGISTPQRTAARDTSQPKSLKQYAESMGLPEEYLLSKRWEEGTHQNRPCIFVPNEDGWRQARYLDGNKPKWKPEFDLDKHPDGSAKLAFYGSSAAKRIAKERNLKFLMLVNGASSVEALQYYGVPAFAIVGGEQNIARKVYTDRILNAWPYTILIALDADKAGQDSSKKFVQLLGERGLAIELGGLRDSGFDGADFAALWQEQSLSRLIMLAEQSETERPPRTAHEAAQAVIDEIEGKRKIKGRIIPQPFKTLHRFGGNALFLEPNLMTGVVGLSGHGKTAFWQTMVKDLLLSPRKWGILIDSREFTPQQDSIRRMQGEMTELKISQDIINSHKVWAQEESEGIPAESRQGKRMRPELIDELKNINAFMQMSWLGTMEFAENHRCIEDTLDSMKRRTLEAREQGLNMDLWILDYLTLYRCKEETLKGVGKNLYGVIAQTIKDAAREVNVHVILMMQPVKTAGAEALARNERLKITDIAYVNENDLNCVIALNTLYGAQGEWQTGFSNKPEGAWIVKRDAATGERITGKAVLTDGKFACLIEILKNTGGITGVAAMKADFARIQWVDEGWTNADLRLPLDAGL